MANERKSGARAGKRKAPVVGIKRRARVVAGRTAVRRETVAGRPLAMDEHTLQVRERIDAALAEAQRMREGIEQRIEQGMLAVPQQAVTPPARRPARGRGRAG